MGGGRTKTDVLHLRGRAGDGAMRLQKFGRKASWNSYLEIPKHTQLQPFLVIFHQKHASGLFLFLEM